MISAARLLLRLRLSHSREWLFCLFATAFLVAYSGDTASSQLAGATMGTTWYMSYIATHEAPDDEALQHRIEKHLEKAYRSISMYWYPSPLCMTVA